MSDKSHSGFGFGKIILCGEHFVVQNERAIVCALPQQTHATITKSDVFNFIDDRPKPPSFKPLQTPEYYALVREILLFAGINELVTVRLTGALPVFSGGLGSSAACAAAIAQAACVYAGIDMDKNFINNVALSGEKAVHGNPSGIDNTAAVFGGMFSFQKNIFSAQRPFVQPINISKPLHFVIADSCIKAKTKECIASIAKVKQDSSTMWNHIVGQYKNVYAEMIEALACGDIKRVGLLMTCNHTLLQQLDLSIPPVDYIIGQALACGALGAKVTGTGRGGSIIILAENCEQQKELLFFFERQGYPVLPTVIDMGQQQEAQISL